MKTLKYFLCLVLMGASFAAYAQGSSKGVEKFEMSIQIGAGFTWANNAPLEGVTRMPDFAWAPDKASKFPAFEAYGAVLRYNIDERWTVQAQGMRQRLRFNEVSGEESHFYYNAAWHLDAMAEYNLMRYAFVSNKQRKVYELVPFIAFGAGASMYNKNATYGFGTGLGFREDADGIMDSYQRMIAFNGNFRGHKYPAIDAKNMGAAMYIPFAVGAKLRMTANWQLKVACQYNFYLFGSDGKVDMYGATKYPDPDKVYSINDGYISKTDTKHYYVYAEDLKMDRVKYDDIPAYKSSGFGKNHNLMLTLGIIFNFNPAYKDMILE